MKALEAEVSFAAGLGLPSAVAVAWSMRGEVHIRELARMTSTDDTLAVVNADRMTGCLSRLTHRRGQVRPQAWTTLALFLVLGSTTACKNAMNVRGTRDAAAMDDGPSAAQNLKDTSPVFISLVPPDVGRASGPSDVAMVREVRAETPDSQLVLDLPGPPDTDQTSETNPTAQCAKQVVDSMRSPVTGTARGPKVDGEVCTNGLGTYLGGPNDATNVPLYVQDFYTTTVYTGAVPHNSMAPGVYGFLMHAPADAVSAELSNWIGVSAAAVGTYDSATNCGGLDFKVVLPVPPGVVCPTFLGPCDPGCVGVGEMWVCQPANAELHYPARSSATCESYQDHPPQGDWRLTITSVSPLANPMPYANFRTHGHLTATLVNQDDPSDSVVLNLDF